MQPIFEYQPAFPATDFLFCNDTTTSDAGRIIQTVDGKTIMNMDVPSGGLAAFKGNIAQDRIKQPVAIPRPEAYLKQTECFNEQGGISIRHRHHLSEAEAKNTITDIPGSEDISLHTSYNKALTFINKYETSNGTESSQQLRNKYSEQWFAGYVEGLSTQPPKALAYLQSLTPETSIKGQQIPLATSYAHQMRVPQPELPHQNQSLAIWEMGHESCSLNTVNYERSNSTNPETQKTASTLKQGNRPPAKRRLNQTIPATITTGRSKPIKLCSFFINILENPLVTPSIGGVSIANNELLQWHDRAKGVFTINTKNREIIVQHYNATCSKPISNWNSMNERVKYYKKSGRYFLKYLGNNKSHKRGFRQFNTQHPEIKNLLCLSRNSSVNTSSHQYPVATQGFVFCDDIPPPCPDSFF